jgi:chemotaxis protein MotB
VDKECPKCPECVKGSPAYMTTFGDMMSLLLTFFVMLLSMANFDITKFTLTVQSLQGAFGVLESYPTVAILPVIKIPRHSGDEARRRMSFEDAKKIEQTIKEQDLEQSVSVEMTEKGIAILLKDPVGFASGSADLSAQGERVVRRVADVLKDKPDLKIRVEGHTDDVPIRTARFPSNWDLSAARALAVVKVLAAGTRIHPANMSAVGFGEYRPLVPNTSAENRSRNRRIQIFVDYIDG